MSSSQIKTLALFVSVFIAVVNYANVYFSSFFTGIENFSWFVLGTDIFVYLVMWAISWKIIQRYSKKENGIDWLLFILAIIVIALFKLFFYLGVKQYMIVFGPQNDSIGFLHIITNLAKGILVGFIIVSIQYFLFFQQKWSEEQLKTANLEKENSKAQLSALQTQINPHFLFNNLNTLQSMIEPNNQRAQDFLVELSSLYRYLLNKNQQEVVLLKEEIEISEKFNFLIKERFGQNYRCNFEIGEELKNIKYVPPFSIQMLLENVVKHNRIDDEHQVVCEVFVEKNFLIVRNNIHPKNAAYTSNNIGLSNLRKRYQLLSDLKVVIAQTENDFIAKIPLLNVVQYD